MALKRLYDWRIQCTAQQLQGFETALAPVFDDTIRQQILKTCYNSSYHCALLSKNTLLKAIQFSKQHDTSVIPTTGEHLVQELAKHNGDIASEDLKTEFNAALLTLKARGIIFEQDSHYHLPADFILLLNRFREVNTWFSLCHKFPKKLLQQIIPDDIDFITARSDEPSHNAMAAWLACEGFKSHEPLRKTLDDKDWELLHHLDMYGDIHSFKTLSTFCGDAKHAMKIPGQPEPASELQGALERHIPERLQKLCLMGFIGFLNCKGRDKSIKIVMSAEGGYRLLPYWDTVRTDIADMEKESWAASKCKIGTASPWLHDHDLWRLWITLHFMPLRKTRNGDLRKLDVKKILSLLKFDTAEVIEIYSSALVYCGFLTESPTALTPASIDWTDWLKRQRRLIMPTDHNKPSQQKMLTRLISELPVDTWLEIDKVVSWLKTKAGHTLAGLSWHGLFMQRQAVNLHHLNKSDRYIYLPPLYHAVIRNELPSLPSPGWLGTEGSAITTGFITATGCIQLSPEFSHKKLKTLINFCTLTGIGHMIELRLNSKVLMQMGTDKKQLMACKRILESIQSPLPQPVCYLFDKQMKQRPMARIEATSLLVRLHDPVDIDTLFQLGFPLRQPFPDLPDIILLEDGLDAHSFILACQEAGIALEIGSPPKCWVEGFASVLEWIKEPVQRSGQWLEICYQKQRNVQATQVTARIERNFSGGSSNFSGLEIRIFNKTARGYSSLKDPLYLESKHIIHLRILNTSEIISSGLDQLS